MSTPQTSVPRDTRDICGALPENSLLPLWRRINQEFLLRVQRGNTPPTVAIALMYLHYNTAENEPAKLADALGIPRQSMTTTLDYLEANQLAERLPHPHDRRRKQVVLTASGRARAETIFTDLLWLESYALQAVDGPDLAKLQQFLSRYAEALSESNRMQPHLSEPKEI